MTKDPTYNGWVNYETWADNLWLTNEENTSELLDEITKKADSFKPYQQADMLKDMVQDWMYDFTDNVYESGGSIHSGLFIDLLKAGFDNVNWDAIIEHHKDDID